MDEHLKRAFVRALRTTWGAIGADALDAEGEDTVSNETAADWAMEYVWMHGELSREMISALEALETSERKEVKLAAFPAGTRYGL